MNTAVHRMLAFVGSVSILLISMGVYAADDDILQFIPAFTRAQTSVDPAGSWIGDGTRLIPETGCLSSIAGATMAIDNTTKTGIYTLRIQYTSTPVEFKGTCSDSRDTTEYAVINENKMDSTSMSTYYSAPQVVGYIGTTNNHVEFSTNKAVLTRKEYLFTPANGWTQSHVVTITFARQ